MSAILSSYRVHTMCRRTRRALRGNRSDGQNRLTIPCDVRWPGVADRRGRSRLAESWDPLSCPAARRCRAGNGSARDPRGEEALSARESDPWPRCPEASVAHVLRVAPSSTGASYWVRRPHQSPVDWSRAGRRQATRRLKCRRRLQVRSVSRKRQTKCMVGIFAAHAAGVKSAML